jgi:hypothetical protein
MQSNYTEFKEALADVRDHLIPHFESSPVWHLMWPQIRGGNDAASLPNLLGCALRYPGDTFLFA